MGSGGARGAAPVFVSLRRLWRHIWLGQDSGAGDEREEPADCCPDDIKGKGHSTRAGVRGARGSAEVGANAGDASVTSPVLKQPL